MGQKVAAFKSDGKVKFEITVGYLHRLQQIYMYILGSKNEEELKRFEEIIKAQDKEKIEHWMELSVFLTHFITSIEEQAETEGQITEIDMDDYIKNVKSITDPTPEKD